jgi:hypothetical protein
MLRSGKAAVLALSSAALFAILIASGTAASGDASPVLPAPVFLSQMSTQSQCPPSATLDLTSLLPSERDVCRGELTPDPLADTMRGGRTCRCSCGFPCKTDADCGGAVGSCRSGISCC